MTSNVANILGLVRQLLSEHCTQHGIDDTHGVNHANAVLKHAQNALACASYTTHLDRNTLLAIQLAALLHDADDHKYFPGSPGSPGSPGGDAYPHAVRMMRSANVNESTIVQATRMINWVSCSKNGNDIPEDAKDHPELLIPRWADRLEAIGTIGIERCYDYTERTKRPFWVDTTPRPTNIHELWLEANDERFARYQAHGGKSASFIDHFYDKLLPLTKAFEKEGALVQNEYLEQEATRRLTPMIELCLAYGNTGRLPPNLSPNRPSSSPPQLPFPDRYAITFGETSILHVGGAELSSGRRSRGFSVKELQAIAARINRGNPPTQEAPSGEVVVHAEIVDLSVLLPETVRANNSAAVLVIRNGVHYMKGDANALYAEQKNIPYDRLYFDARRQKTLNKRARFNVVFGDVGQTASADYRSYTVHAFDQLPHLNILRDTLPTYLGEDARALNAEGNHYYADGSGIGFHGDAERKIVVCVSLGRSTTLRYHWRKPGGSDHESDVGPIDIQVNHGDIYVMSEKATGYDWRMTSKYRVVHAAGAAQYITRKITQKSTNASAIAAGGASVVGVRDDDGQTNGPTTASRRVKHRLAGHEVTMSKVVKKGGKREGQLCVQITGPRASTVNPVSGKRTFFVASMDDNAANTIACFIGCSVEEVRKTLIFPCVPRAAEGHNGRAVGCERLDDGLSALAAAGAVVDGSGLMV